MEMPSDAPKLFWYFRFLRPFGVGRLVIEYLIGRQLGRTRRMRIRVAKLMYRTRKV